MNENKENFITQPLDQVLTGLESRPEVEMDGRTLGTQRSNLSLDFSLFLFDFRQPSSIFELRLLTYRLPSEILQLLSLCMSAPNGVS